MGNTGQMLLILGAILLFSLMLPSLNETILQNDRTMVRTQTELTATTQPRFGYQLTPVASLGAESGEAYPNYDDLDDFADLALLDTTSLASISYTLTGAVTYMNPAAPSSPGGSPTFVKRLRVTVSSPYLLDPGSEQPMPIMLDQIYTYY